MFGKTPRPARQDCATGESRDVLPIRSLFFLLHCAAAAFDATSAALGDNHLGAALPTDVNLAELIRHFLSAPEILSWMRLAIPQLSAFENRFSLLQKSFHSFGAIGRSL